MIFIASLRYTKFKLLTFIPNDMSLEAESSTETPKNKPHPRPAPDNGIESVTIKGSISVFRLSRRGSCTWE